MTGRTALVTGAASGIGAAVVLAAAHEGARVAALDIEREGLQRVAAHARRQGADVLALEVDVRSEEAVEAAVRLTCDRFGVPVAVLANAGIEVNAPAHELKLAEWTTTLEVNLTGVFLTVRHAIRAILHAGVGGSVVCTSSPAAFVGFAGGNNAAYAASKGGVSAMVRSLALDYAKAGIRVNAVVPGPTDTPLLTAAAPAQERVELRNMITEQARDQVPLRRLASAEEVANAVLWLWSDQASYVTGSHLVVDGGVLAKSANSF